MKANMVQGTSLTVQNILKVLELYEEADEKIEKFKNSTGLKCPENCGRCCEKMGIEATVLEFLPLAASLWKTQKAEGWLKSLHETKTPKRCIFYEPSDHISGNGQCSVYPLRGLLCRLFGFSALKDKTGRARLSGCAVIKKYFPDKFENTIFPGTSVAAIPIFTSYSSRLICLDPYFGVKFFPINVAIETAIEKIGFNPNLLQEITELQFPYLGAATNECKG